MIQLIAPTPSQSFALINKQPGSPTGKAVPFKSENVVSNAAAAAAVAVLVACLWMRRRAFGERNSKPQ